MDEDSIQREKKIQTIVQQEIVNGEALATAVANIAHDLLLGCKGYSQNEVRQHVAFTFALGTETHSSKMDFLVSLGNRNAMVIKCAAGSLSSRERHVVAAARVLADIVVPIAVVMDPSSALVIDVSSGNVIGEGFESIPTREKLTALLLERKSFSIASDKLEREMRILLAFDAIQCCVPQGVDGGVSLK